MVRQEAYQTDIKADTGKICEYCAGFSFWYYQKAPSDWRSDWHPLPATPYFVRIAALERRSIAVMFASPNAKRICDLQSTHPTAIR